MEEQLISWQRRLSLRARLLLGFGVFSLLLIGLSGFVAYQLQRISDANDALRMQTQRTLAAEDLSRARSDLVLAIDEAILVQDRGAFRSRVGVRLATLDARYEELMGLLDETDPALEAAIYNLRNIVQYLVEIAAEDDWEEIRRTRVTALGNEIIRISESLDALVADSNQAQGAALEATVKAQQSVVRSILVGSLTIFLVAAGVAFSTIQSFERTSNELVEGAERLAAGELSHHVNIEARGGMGRLARAFNQMAVQLQQTYDTLESRIAERTATLQDITEQMRTSAEVGRVATTILDPEELQNYVVRLISDRFGFYHAGLFLLNETQTYAVLKAASSEGGRRMLARNHHLGLGEGIVGRVMQTGEPYRALDTGGDVVYFDNPDLPETRSEVALPLRARGEIIGILDVQSKDPDAFSDENMTVFQGLADQIALALDNARLYQETRERLAEVQSLYGEFSEEAWRDIIQTHRTGYRYNAKDGLSKESVWYDEMRSALQSGEIEQTIDADTESGVLAVPLHVRGLRLGVLRLRKPPKSGPWTDEEIAVIKVLTEQIGPTLDSARLFEAAQQQAARERLVGQISSQMRAVPIVDAVLETAVREIGESLGLHDVTVKLESDDGTA